MKKNDVKNDSRKDNNLMVKIATFIVDKRRAFYLIFALALVLCVISIPKVQVNNDISSYLPEETETRRGLTLMDDEFITYDTEKIMVTTITTETAEKLKDKLEKVDGVKEVEFENDDDHYKDSAALFTVTLSVRDDLDRELEIVDDLKAQLDGYDFYAYSDSIDDSSKRNDSYFGYSACDNYSGFAVHVTELYGSADIPYSIRRGGTFEYGYELSAR